MNTLLKTYNLSKRYKNTLALNNVNMTINHGDIYGFVGENGAGKSTLIRVITGINNPTSGNFVINTSKRLGSVAAIVETPALHQRLSATDNLIYQNELLALDKTRDELADLLTMVGLSDQIGSKKQCRNFSLGMKQRLSIAVALLSNPQFILLDEPMNGLDPAGIKEIRELIVKLNKEGVTFLISSHILSELDKIATVYGFISHGILVKEISAKELHSAVGGYAKMQLNAPLDDKGLTLLSEFKYRVEGDTLFFDIESDGQKAMQVLIKNDYTVISFEIVRQSIEDYYFKVIGGGRHA